MIRHHGNQDRHGSVNDDELASDFLEIVTLKDDTVLYRGAQVAVESTSVTCTSAPEKRMSSKQVPRQLKATKCLEFSVKRPEDKGRAWVKGILCVLHDVVVVDNDNKVLKLFDKCGTYLSSTILKYPTWGITFVCDNTFATCGDSNTVNLWTVHGKKIVSDDVSYHVDHDANGIHYNGTYYCVLHREVNVITILDRQGRQARKIIKTEACRMELKFGLDIHMDSDTKRIYLPCWDEDGVLCMTLEGHTLWFTPLQFSPWGITEIQGTLCVDGYADDYIHLMTKEGEYVRKLLGEEELGGMPECVCYGHDDRLYVSYEYSVKHDIISVYTAKYVS